jgi:outer membrane protein
MRPAMSHMHRNSSMNSYFKSGFYFLLIIYGYLPILGLGQSNSLKPSFATIVEDVEELHLHQEVTLDVLLEYALRRNFTMYAAQQRVLEQSGLALEVKSGLMPRLSIQSRYSEQDESLAMNTYRPGDWTVSLQLSQPLFAGGGLLAQSRSQELIVEAFRYASATQIASTIQTVTKEFYAVLQAEENIEVELENIALLQEQLSSVTSLFDNGVVSKFDVLQAKVSLANAKPQLILAENSLRLALAQLQRSIGFRHDTYIDGFHPEAKFIGPAELEMLDYASTNLLDVAFQQRPEIKEQEMYLASSKEGLKAARSGRWPTLSLSGGYDFRRSYEALDDRFENIVDGWTVGLTSSWNIWDGRENAGRIMQAMARVRQSEIQIEIVKQNIKVEVQTALSEIESATELLNASEKTTELAIEALRLADERYAVGRATYLDNLQARLALTQARNNKVRAKYRYLSAGADLERAIAANLIEFF